MTENITTSLVNTWNHPLVLQGRVMFYLCSPGETTYPTEDKVPKFVDKAIPYFIILIVLEGIILTLQGKRLPRFNDAFSSMSAGLFSLIPLLLVRNIEVTAYIWVHANWCLVDLPWDSPLTWWLCMLGVDLGYYWVHRMAHEVNFMWAAHQAHHSSEDYNLTTALRQSVLQRYSSWVFYLPLALCIPPSVFMVHIQLNLLYQFWIHTEVIDKMGPLEYIINTPSHHRVHHGRNRYCIDKNYGGTLIIWDRIFGTFAAEGEDIAYGLTHPVSSWNVVYIQFCQWQYILQKAWTRKGILNKLSTYLKGPGWAPGKPRLGHITDIPDVRAPLPKYDRKVHLGKDLYIWMHFVLANLAYGLMQTSEATAWQSLYASLFLLLTITCLGFIYEKKKYAALFEFLRCILYLFIDSYLCSGDAKCPVWISAIRVIYFVCVPFWGMQLHKFEEPKLVTKVA